MLRTGLSKRVLLPVIFVFVLTAIFAVSRPQLDQLPHVGRNTKSQTPDGMDASMEKEALDKVAESADMIYPLFDYTYDKIATLSAEVGHAKDPCIDVMLPEGGDEAKSGEEQLVMVTGGAGFIGSNLVDRLVKLGYKVRIFDNLYTGFLRNVALDNPNVEFVLGDILDHKALDKAMEGVQFVYHLAAMSKVVPSLKNPDMARFCTEANALGSWNVLDSVRQAGDVKKVIYAASSTYYGNRAPPHSEDMPADFLTPYAASKYEGEIQMQMFDRLFGVPTISTRFFMVYGPRQPSTGAYAIVTGVFAKQAADGRALTIEGDGTHYRDFIHVRDIVEGMILAQQNSELHGDVVNLGSGTAFSVNDVANLVSSNQVNVDPRPNDLEGTLADTCKMKRLLNYKAKADFKTEMGYMAKQTMEGNVFMQSWLKPIHALAAPHLMAPGSPVFDWPAKTNDLDALLLSLKHVHEATLSEDEEPTRRVSVIVFGTKSGDSLETRSDLLLNTVFSLVRFGEVRQYLVAAADEKALAACVALNLPCLDAHALNAATLLTSLTQRGLDVHVARLGNSYVGPVADGLAALRKQHGAEVDVLGAAPQGDVFVRASDKARAALDRWAKAADLHPLGQPDAAELLHNVNAWPAMDVALRAFAVEQYCNATGAGVWEEPNASSLAAGSSALPTSPAADESALDKAAAASSSSSSDSESESSSKKGSDEQVAELDRVLGKRGLFSPRRAESATAEIKAVETVCDRKFYRAVGCSQPSALPAAAEVIASLKATDAWHLTECKDTEHCDRQQVVPRRWVASPPDLKPFGGIC